MKALVILNTILEDEEYEDMECVASGFIKSYFEKAISELEAIKYNYEAQEIIIKDLKSQLSSNPLQLNCDGCEHLEFSMILNSETCTSKEDCKRYERIIADKYPDLFKPKDTK